MQKTVPYHAFLLVLPPCSGLSIQEKSLHHILSASRVEKIELWWGKNAIPPSTLVSITKSLQFIIPVYLSFCFSESYSKSSNLGLWLQGVPEPEEITCNVLCVHTHVYFGKGKYPQLWTNDWRVLCFSHQIGGGR